LALSSCQNVHIEHCQFYDNHVGAIDFSAPSKDLFIDYCHFESSEDADLSYGVRPFCYVAPLTNYDDNTGELLYSAPTVYHENVNVTNCTAYNKGYLILSWNVHFSNYKNNTTKKPLRRGISITNWNFDCLLSGNKYIVENNTTTRLSTCIRVGIGCQRVTIEHERFSGTLDGLTNNEDLKTIHLGSAGRDIVVRNNTFNIVNAQDVIIADKDCEVIIENNSFLKDSLVTACITIKGSDTGNETYSGKEVLIRNNKFKSHDRGVAGFGESRGEVIILKKTLLTSLW
jgi:hypothetical protein